jgi:hypothetical protein
MRNRQQPIRGEQDLDGLGSYLWHVATGKGHTVTTDDVGDASKALNPICCHIRENLSPPVVGGPRQPPVITLDTLILNATQQALLLTSVIMMTMSLVAVNSKKKEKRSILNGMSPSNRELFTRLCTKDIRHDPPKMSKFLKSLLGEKNASHIANHLCTLTKRWKGTFIEGAVCCFLGKG